MTNNDPNYDECGQIVVKYGGYKKQDVIRYLKISDLQSLVVPRAGLTEVR